jgi:hypothetical protein
VKIIVCGIPPAQSRKMERQFPDHDLRVFGAQENERHYRAHMVECDLCVVNTQLISHNMVAIIRKSAPRVVMVKGPSSAVAAINDALRVR